MAKEKTELNIKVPDELFAAKFADIVQVSHTAERFIIDFMQVPLDEGILVARIALGATHVQRIIDALQENLNKYKEIN